MEYFYTFHFKNCLELYVLTSLTFVVTVGKHATDFGNYNCNGTDGCSTFLCCVKLINTFPITLVSG